MTKIQWTDKTWNPVVGCTRASRGCDHCYAVQMTHRLACMADAKIERGVKPGKLAKYIGLTVLNNKGDRHFNGTVRFAYESLGVPMRWKKPRRIFVNSMSDLFHPGVPLDFVDQVFAVMALCPQHTFQILTKRPDRMAEYMDECYDRVFYSTFEFGNVGPRAPLEAWPLPNVWLGTSCEDQAAADDRIPHLLKCPAAVRFLSLEPLLESIQISVDGCFFDHGVGGLGKTAGISWLICGGESGPDARPCDVAWIESVVEQCQAVGTACFVKQLGSNPVGVSLTAHKGDDPAEWPERLQVREMPQ